MSIMQEHRWLAQLAAQAMRAFWLPCPACGTPFGGHEWTRVEGHAKGLPSDIVTDHQGERYASTGIGICPDCTYAGVGCKARKAAGLPVHEGCQYVTQITSHEGT